MLDKGKAEHAVPSSFHSLLHPISSSSTSLLWVFQGDQLHFGKDTMNRMLRKIIFFIILLLHTKPKNTSYGRQHSVLWNCCSKVTFPILSCKSIPVCRSCLQVAVGGRGCPALGSAEWNTSECDPAGTLGETNKTIQVRTNQRREAREKEIEIENSHWYESSHNKVGNSLTQVTRQSVLTAFFFFFIHQQLYTNDARKERTVSRWWEMNLFLSAGEVSEFYEQNGFGHVVFSPFWYFNVMSVIFRI